MIHWNLKKLKKNKTCQFCTSQCWEPTFNLNTYCNSIAHSTVVNVDELNEANLKENLTDMCRQEACTTIKKNQSVT